MAHSLEGAFELSNHLIPACRETDDGVSATLEHRDALLPPRGRGFGARGREARVDLIEPRRHLSLDGVELTRQLGGRGDHQVHRRDDLGDESAVGLRGALDEREHRRPVGARLTDRVGVRPEFRRLDEAIAMAYDSVEFLRNAGLRVFFDAEHFFDGYVRDPAFALRADLTGVRALPCSGHEKTSRHPYPAVHRVP